MSLMIDDNKFLKEDVVIKKHNNYYHKLLKYDSVFRNNSFLLSRNEYFKDIFPQTQKYFSEV